MFDTTPRSTTFGLWDVTSRRDIDDGRFYVTAIHQHTGKKMTALGVQGMCGKVSLGRWRMSGRVVDDPTLRLRTMYWLETIC